ncbi:MAG TPA: HAMP domain-containing sensor histidine kinase, partial [Polyangiales bacterium]|nr:HAMP domain-containing sensor histidine kinase [Polyangiales bacterium]
MAERTPRERLLTFLLLPAIVIAVLVLSGVMFRSSFQLEKLREQSVVEATLSLANERADRLDKRIIEQDNAVRSVLDLTQRSDFGSKWLDTAALQTPTVRAVFLIDIGAPAHNVVALSSRAPELETEHLRRLLVNRLLPELKLDKPPLDELRHLHKVDREKAYLLSHWEQELDGRHFLVVVWHDVPRIVHDVFPALYSDVQQSRVNVVDADGKIVFGPPLGRGGLTLGRQFETTLYKWTLNVTMNSAEELAAAVARRRLLEMVLVGLSSVVVIAGLFVILVAAERERRLSNLKSEFVANVSHELKTPLALVRMFGELLQSGRADTDEKRHQYLSIIVNESDRLNALIENVLDFAKVERGEAAYEFSPGHLAEPVSRAVEACRVRAEREGVALELTLEPVPVLLLDERAVEIAVINLVDNALKYAPDGKRIAVSVRSAPDGAEVWVADAGPGIAAEDRKRIFQRFVRGKSSSGKQVRGSGIGLSLVKHIAEAHGGSVRIEDAEPRGAVFILRLGRKP